MSHPLPGVPVPKGMTDRRVAEDALTDDEGYYRGGTVGVVHEIDDEVPDNAHWKGWVWKGWVW
jgi:hypothetical protein